MKKISIILLTGLFAGFFFVLPASAQDKKSDKKTDKSVNDSNDLEWVEEVAHRALVLSEEAARRAESVSREMERRAYHRMEQNGRRGQERMERGDSAGWHRPFNSWGKPDSLEMSGFHSHDFRNFPEFPDMSDLPPIPDLPDMKGKYGDMHFNMPFPGYMFSDSKSGSSWNYSRRLNDATYASEYNIAVDAASDKINLSVSGNCNKGSITITVLSPDGKKISDIIIDENGNMNWRKSYKADENKWTKGNWTFKVTTKSATGNFNISLDSF
jgi:hypothetical protein